MKKFFTKFDEISKNHPDKIAIETPDYSLTYLQLAKDINLIATGMRNEGVVCGDIIGFFGDRDTSIVKSFLAVLKIGGIFLHLSKDHPNEVINNLIEKSQLKWLIHSSHLGTIKTASHLQKIDFEDLSSISTVDDDQSVHDWVSQEICLYRCSSGTESIPKIIPITCEALESQIIFIANCHYKIRFKDKIFFSGAWFDYIPPMTFYVGSTLCLFDLKKFDPLKICGYLNFFQVSILPTYPIYFRLLTNVKQSIQYVRIVELSGEILTKQDLINFNFFFTEGSVLLNTYGTEELSYISTYRYHINNKLPYKNIPIGIPVEGIEISLKDEDRRHVEKGQIGEIVVKYKHLPQNYVGGSHKVTGTFHGGHYFTGDVASKDHKGQYYYIGRKDDVLKIRGFNISTSSIESILGSHPDVSEIAVVIIERSNHSKMIFCYYKGAISEESLKSFSILKLSSYMVPNHFNKVEFLPKTASGKIRKKELRNYSPKHNQELTFSTPQALAIKDIWSDILGHTDFGIEDRFDDVGGDSLSSHEMIIKIKDMFHDFPLAFVLENFWVSPGSIEYLEGLIINPSLRENIIRPGSSNTAIVVTGTDKGDLQNYSGIINEMENNFKVIGSSGEEDSRQYFKSYQESALYASKILKTQSKIILIGYSVGCIRATEIARILKESCVGLILIDTTFYPYIKNIFLYRLWFSISQLSARPGVRTFLKKTIRTITRINKTEPTKIKQEFRQALNYLNPFNLRGVCKFLLKRDLSFERYLSYKPDPFDFELILIIHSDECKESHLTEWKSLLPGNIEIAHIKGSNHSNIMKEYKYKVSQIIDTWLHSLKVK